MRYFTITWLGKSAICDEYNAFEFLKELVYEGHAVSIKINEE